MLHRLLLISLLLPLTLSAQVPQLLDRAAVLKEAKAVTLEKYPDADTVLVDDLIRVRYEPTGLDTTWDDTYTKALTEKGRQELQGLTFNYNLVYDTVTVHRVELIKADGRIEPVDVAAQSQSMVDRSQMSMNIYDPNDRVLQVSVPNVEVGDVIHYITEHRTLKCRMPGTWVDYQVFEYNAPMRRYVYEVSAPPELPLRRIELKSPVGRTVTATTNVVDGRTVHRWEVRDVPQIFPEPNMPNLYAVAQRLLVSTIPDWQTVSKWYWDISAPHIEATTPDLIAKVKELTGQAVTDRAKVEKLFTFVSQQIRYMGITTETTAPGYEPHDVSITFGNRYGVCRDKAALLVSMLRLAGLKGFPVLIHAAQKKDVEVPMPYFNHAIVAVQEADGKYLLMDPTDENTSDLLPAYLCDKSYLVARPEGETLLTSPIIPATNNLLHVASIAKLDAKGRLELASTLRFEGINDNSYRGYFAGISPAERRRFFDSRLGQLLPGARITKLEIEPANMRDTTIPMTVKLGCEVPDYLVQGEEHQLVALPWIGHAFGTVNRVLGQTGLEKRRFPLQTDVACGVQEQIALELPAAAVPLAKPSAPGIARDDLEFRQTVTCDGNKITGQGAFLLKAVEYAPADYAALKQAIRDIEYARRQRVVLPQAVASSPDADAQIVKRDIRIDVKDAHTWTVRDEQVVRILSYAGKKRLSELHLDYNPIWEQVTITNATVTAKDGKTHTLAAQELNLMDADWVASAPRYPAGKTLVASLPGVEVGSEIRYTVIRERKDRPFFSTLASFRGFDPVAEGAITVVVPTDLPLQAWTHGGDFAHAVTTNGGLATWTWTVTNQPALAREENLPAPWSFCPTVALSSGDWKTYAGALLDPMLRAAKGNPEARKTAKQIARKASGGAVAKATALRDFVDRGVRVAGPQTDDLPVSILTPPDQTLREGYGTARDRALLLYVMLEEAGFKPEFALVSSGTPVLPELRDRWLSAPQGSTFNTVLVRATIDGQPVYFNDTDQYARLGSTPHDGRIALTREGRLVTVEAQSDQRDRMVTRQSIRIDGQGDALFEVTSSFEGMHFAGYRKQMVEQTPEETRRFAQELVATLAQSAQLQGELKSDFDQYPGTISFTARVPRFAVRDGQFLYFNLPPPHHVPFPGGAAERKHAYYDEDRGAVELVYDVSLPAGDLAVAPAPLDATAPGGLVHAVFTADGAVGGNRFVWHQRLDYRPALIPAHRYGELKDWNARVRHPSNRAFMLELAK